MEFKVYGEEEKGLLLRETATNKKKYQIKAAAAPKFRKYSSTYKVYRFLDDGQTTYEVASFRRDGYSTPNYVVHLGPKHEEIILPYPKKVSGKRSHRTSFRWRGTEFAWEEDKEMRDPATSDIMANFKRKCFLTVAVTKRKGNLRLFPSAVHLRETHVHHEKHSLKFWHKEKPQTNDAQQNAQRNEEMEAKELLVLKLDMLVAVSTAMQYQWAGIR